MLDLIVTLSKNRIEHNDKCEIEEYLKKGADWSLLMGQLIFHKLLCRTYSHITAQNWDEHIPSVIKQHMQRQFYLNEHKKSNIKIELMNLVKRLNNTNIQYCIIKGIPLEKDLFCDCVREINDIDVLIHQKDLDQANEILTSLGYKHGADFMQGKIETNKEKNVDCIANTRQAQSYRKTLNDPIYQVNTIDLQFELYLQEKLCYIFSMDSAIKKRICVDISGVNCYVLDSFDNFIFLCTHLYAEAILFRTIKKYKDLQISKFADIYEWLEKYYCLYDWEQKAKQIKSQRLLKPVLFCMYIISSVYGSMGAKNICEQFMDENLDFIDEYRDENFNIKRWKLPAVERIFRFDRSSMM